MKKIAVALMFALLFIGCGQNTEAMKNITPKLVVGKSLANFKLNDQNGKAQTLTPQTRTLFFSFSKKMGHACNAFLEKQSADFLPQRHTFYVADVSPAPSLIKKLFILPDLKKLKFPILLINDDKTSAEYSKGMDKDKIIIVTLDNLKITNIKTATSAKELEKDITK